MTKPHKGAMPAALTRSASRPMCQLFPRMLPKAIARPLCADFCPCSPSLAGKSLTILHLAMTASESPLQAGIFIAQQEPSLTGSAPGGRFCAPGSPAVGERKSTPKRFCSGTLPSATIRRGTLPQKTVLHVRHSYGWMCLWRHFARRGFLSCCQRTKEHAQALLHRNFAATLQSAAALFFQKTAPACHI